MVYPIGYEGQTRRWYAETSDGAKVVIGDLAPHPAAVDLAMNLAWKMLGADNVKRVMADPELVG